MIAGNLPLALALEPGSTVRSSLGTVVIGGVLGSMVMSLLVLRVLYLVFNSPVIRREESAATEEQGRSPQELVSAAR